MDVRTRIDQLLPTGKVMQIATLSGQKPWICSVYYVAEGRTLYWLSWPSRRHSQEIAAQPNVAVAIALHPEQPVVGLQMEGKAEQVADETEAARIVAEYVKRHDVGHKFLENFTAGTNQHEMYRFTPSRIVLFDEQHFPGDARKEVAL